MRNKNHTKVLKITILLIIISVLLFGSIIVAEAAENCSLTVDFNGITVSSVQVRDSSGTVLKTLGRTTDSAVIAVDKGSDYQVTLRQGNVYKTIGSIDCTGSAALVDGVVCAVTVDFSGITLNSGAVYNSTGSLLTQSGRATDSAVYKVLKGSDYKVILRQGNIYKTIELVDCTGDTALVNDLVCDLTVSFPGVTLNSAVVYNSAGSLIVQGGRATDSAVYKVLKGSDYKVTLRQGNVYKTVDSIDCSGNTALVDDLVCDLTVDFPGVTINSGSVTNSEGSLLVQGGRETNTATYKVLKGNKYKVTLRQGNIYKTITKVDCTGNTALVDDLVCDLTVNFPGVTINSGTVYNSASSLITQGGRETDTVTYKVLKGKNYKLTLRQGNMYKTIKGIDCRGNSAVVEDLVCELTVNFPGVTLNGSTVTTGANSLISQGGRATDTAVYKVLKGNNYKLTLRQGNMYKTIKKIDCRGGSAVVDDIVCELTVNFPGFTINGGTVTTSGKKLITSCGRQTDSTVFNVLRGKNYRVTLRVGNDYYSYTKIDCSGPTATIGNTLLKVKFTGIEDVNKVELYKNGTRVDYKTWQDNETTFDVAPGTYSVKLQKGGMTYEINDIFCFGSFKTVTVKTVNVVVNYPGVMDVNKVEVFQNGSRVGYKTWTDETTSFKVFKNWTDYDIRVQKGGMVYEGSVTCSRPVLDVPVIDFTVNYPGVMDVNKVEILQGTRVDYRTWTDETTCFKVFDNGIDYTIKAQKGGMVYEGSGTCAAPVVDIPIIDIVVNYPNVMDVNKVEFYQNSTRVDYKTWTDETCAFKAFGNGIDYLIKLQKGGMLYEGSVTCVDPVLNVPITKLDILFPGIASVNKSEIFQNGTRIDYDTWESDSVSFYLFQNAAPYQARMTKDGIAYEYSSIMCDAPSVVVDKTDVKLDMSGIGGATVRFKQNGTSKYTFYNVDSNQALNVPNGIYDIDITKGGMNTSLTDKICLGDETALAVSTGTITFDFTGVPDVKVVLSQGAGVQTKYNQTDTSTFTVFNNGGTYDAVLTKGGMSINASGNVGDTVVIPLSTVGVNFPDINGVKVTLIQASASVYTTYNNNETEQFLVFDNGMDYAVTAVKGGMSTSKTGSAGGDIDLDVNTIAVDFTGVTGVKVTLTQNGAGVHTVYNQDNSCSFTVFDNGIEYGAIGAKGGMSDSGTGNAGGTINLLKETLTVDFAGLSGVKVNVNQGGTGVYTVYNQTDASTFTVFNNGTDFTAIGTIGGMSMELSGPAGGTITFPTKTVTALFPGVNATKVILKQNGNIYTVYNVSDSADFLVFDNGLPYEAEITSSSGTVTVPADVVTTTGLDGGEEPSPRDEPQQQPQTQPDPEPETQQQPQNQPQNQPQEQPQTQPQNEPEQQPETQPEQQPETQPEQQPETQQGEGEDNTTRTSSTTVDTNEDTQVDINDKHKAETEAFEDEEVPAAAGAAEVSIEQDGFSLFWLIPIIGVPVLIVLLWLFIASRRRHEDKAA